MPLNHLPCPSLSSLCLGEQMGKEDKQQRVSSRDSGTRYNHSETLRKVHSWPMTPQQQCSLLTCSSSILVCLSPQCFRFLVRHRSQVALPADRINDFSSLYIHSIFTSLYQRTLPVVWRRDSWSTSSYSLLRTGKGRCRR